MLAYTRRFWRWVPKLRASQEGGGLAAAWATLDAIELKNEWKYPCATVREVPEFFRRHLQEAFYVATARIREMHGKQKDLELERAWKLFLLLPRMLLSRSKQRGDDGKLEFFSRFRSFQRGDWVKLVRAHVTLPECDIRLALMSHSRTVTSDSRSCHTPGP